MQGQFAAALLMLALVAALPVSAQAPPEAGSPRALYQIGAAREAAARCRGLALVETGSQTQAPPDSKGGDISSRAIVMGGADFAKEFSAAYAKGLEQQVCDRYLRRYPWLLTRR
ncbi:hypothetical protein SAMN05216304_11297 [Bosea sp. OK403]|uniref:hypothetical protein n=1 Tax=Bosea sp. OK403 TaxID=1855286 RepID=UPI0008EF7374|nr:hypothetical protein [Bosea sp. OK403]SFJ71431.1 hypothetical protein SAMN05216304_11297 [Bosea sp. OK403]